mmetsp:Transcript_535/g.875  ORF Transcript_535/g.875 Transcript_535/m.875 type:complete len:81 (+) Transcript_535:14-256(+)
MYYYFNYISFNFIHIIPRYIPRSTIYRFTFMNQFVFIHAYVMIVYQNLAEPSFTFSKFCLKHDNWVCKKNGWREQEGGDE